ncbi:MAG: hypothetical protein HQK52_14960 [Oligoflexia bacterium]|nr:hypothetical protein [Oligoflexia bacterium]
MNMKNIFAVVSRGIVVVLLLCVQVQESAVAADEADRRAGPASGDDAVAIATCAELKTELFSGKELLDDGGGGRSIRDVDSGTQGTGGTTVGGVVGSDVNVYQQCLNALRDSVPKKLCEREFNADPAFLANKAAKDFGLMMAAQAATQSAANTGMGMMAKNQADQLGEIAARYRAAAAAQGSPSVLPRDDLLADECQVDPSLPKCKLKLGDNGERLGFGNSGDIVINPNAAGTYVEGLTANAEMDTQKAAGRGGNADPNKVGGALGEHGALPGYKGDGNFEGGDVGAATVKHGGGGGGGGGGGSASAPGAPAVGGGGDNQQKKGAGGNTASTIAFGGNKGAIGYQGGGGGGGKDGGKGENPFDKLLGNKDPTGKGERLDLRGPASNGGVADSSTGLFLRISNRYQSVYKNNRLVLYETVEPK